MKAPEGSEQAYQFADLTLEVATHRVLRNGHQIPLPVLSFDLLLALLRHAPRVLSADELMTLVWQGRIVNTETVAKRVELLRQALGDDVDAPRYIAVVRGRGYRVVPDVRSADLQQPETSTTAGGQAAADRAPGVKLPRRAAIAFTVAALVVTIGLWLVHDYTRDNVPLAVQPGPGAATASIAVLPFLNLSEDPSNAWFSDGMSEELLGTLAKMPDLRVASRTSSFAFRGTNASLGEIAGALNVSHILEGSVRKAGDRIRVTAQLIDARTDSHLWTENYDRNLEDVFAIQQEIADHIAEALQIRLVSGDKPRAPPTRNLEAYQLYLQGVQVWNLRGERNIRQAIRLLTNAVELDPGFARAHAALGIALASGPFWFDDPEPDLLARATSAAERAMKLDPTLAHPHCVLAVAAVIDRDWAAAEAHFQRALELNPNDSIAQYWLSEVYSVAGRTAPSLELILAVLERDAINVALLYDVANLYLRHHRFEEGCPYVERGMRIGTNVHIYLQAVQCREHGGDPDAIRDALIEAERAFGFERPVFQLVHQARKDPSRKAAAIEAIKYEDARGRWTPMLAYRDLGDYDMVFDVIEMLWRRGNYGTLRALWDVEARELRAHPRFRQLVEDIGLVDYWRKSGWPEVCQPAGESFTCQ